MQLILASTSRYRAELLQRLGMSFSTQSPDVDETRLPGEAADELVSRLSLAKARAVAATSKNALVIGSDQVAVFEDQILGKPGSENNAVAQLEGLSGNNVNFLTGLVLINTVTGGHQLSMVTTPVQFRDLSAAQIHEYVRREQPLDCAGAFKSEGLGIALFSAIGGDDPSALIGLPLIQLCSMLDREGVDVLTSDS